MYYSSPLCTTTIIDCATTLRNSFLRCPSVFDLKLKYPQIIEMAHLQSKWAAPPFKECFQNLILSPKGCVFVEQKAKPYSGDGDKTADTSGPL